jgi:hypothetical protein
MLALIASPAFKPAFGVDFLCKPCTSNADKIARIITNLHGTLVNPNAAPGAAAAAKRMLLGILDRTKGMRLPFMIVPPLAEPRAPRPREPDAERLDDALCETCKRPNPFSRKARVSSSPSFSAKTLPSRARRAFSTTRTSATQPRNSDLTNTPNTYDHTHRYTARH